MVDTRRSRSRVPAPAVPERRSGSGSPTPLTARGGVVVIFLITALGTLLGWLSDVGWAPGAAFVVGCLLAVLSVRQPDLVGLVVSPPVTFVAVILSGEIIAGWGDGKAAAGLFLRLLTDLVAITPWLFTGTLLVLGVAMARGLPASVREFGARLEAERADAREEPDEHDEPGEPGDDGDGPDEGDDGQDAAGPEGAADSGGSGEDVTAGDDPGEAAARTPAARPAPARARTRTRTRRPRLRRPRRSDPVDDPVRWDEEPPL